MVFCLTVLDKQAHFREFMFMPAQLEAGLDFVSNLVAQGETVIKVLFDEDHKLIELPLSIFDGDPFLAPIQKLEQEWQVLLNQPVRPNLTADQELIELTQKRLYLCESALANQLRMIDRFEALLQRAEAKSSFPAARSTLMGHYKHQISLYTQQATQSKHRQLEIRKRLKVLC